MSEALYITIGLFAGILLGASFTAMIYAWKNK